MGKRKAEDSNERYVPGEGDKKRKATANGQQGNAFLSLPGEIRNTIYRHVLIENDDIDIDAQFHLEPGILQVSHQTRREATPIYRQENEFNVDMMGGGSEFIRPAAEHWVWHLGGGAKACMWICDIDLEELRWWLDAYGLDRSFPAPDAFVGEYAPDAEVAVRGFDIVDTLLNAGVGWVTIMVTVDLYLKGTAAREPPVEQGGWCRVR